MDYINPELLQGIGVISPPRSYPHASPRDRCVGTALDDNDVPVLTPNGGSTVKVTYADGTTDFKSAAGFHAKRARASQERAQQPNVQRMPDVVRYASIIGYTGDVGS